jgi:hypothetical protein
MRVVLGIAVIIASCAGLAVGSWFLRRHRSPGWLNLAVVAVAGAGLGIGALLPQHGVRPAEWILAPSVLAALLPVHFRLLFVESGPLRV